MRVKTIAACALFALCFAGSVRAAAGASRFRKSRTFEFTYKVTVDKFPAGAHQVRIWIPLAKSNHHQTVQLLRTSGTVPLRVTHESEYGDAMLYAEVAHPSKPLTFTIAYHVTRREYSAGNFHSLMAYNGDPVEAQGFLKRYLEPDRMVQINGKIAQVAKNTTEGKTGPIEQAHAIYTYVFQHMRYEKVGTGWGRGDALWACDSHHGNCTDFHSLFIGMMRSKGIPARFVIGFPLPRNQSAGMIPGYHCWAEFYVAHLGWVPVDISEAWLAPKRFNYYFGTVGPSRVRMSAGRDITLSPPQKGAPINFFVYPYVEVDGKPFHQVADQFSFHDIAKN